MVRDTTGVRSCFANNKSTYINVETITNIALKVTSGASVIITIPAQYLKDGKFFDLEFVLSKPDRVAFRDLIEGNEIVTIINGVGGAEYAAFERY